MSIYNPNEILYLCDPRKNRDCKKTSCFINCGPCKSTQHKEYAITDENGKAVESIDDILGTLEHNTSGLVDE